MKAQFRDFFFVPVSCTLLIILVRPSSAFALVGELGDLDYAWLLDDWLHTLVCGVWGRCLLQLGSGLICRAIVSFLLLLRQRVR